MIARQEISRVVTNPPLMVGLVSTSVLILMGIFGTQLAPHDPNAGTSLVWWMLPNGNTSFGVPPTMPESSHWLGTDPLGRDQWSRILAGAWLTLSVVLAGTFARIFIGAALGLASGWYGGWLSRGLGAVARAVTSVPQLVLAILLVLVTRPFGVAGFIASLAFVGWPEIAEFLNAETRRAKALPFMEAARSTGARDRRLVTTHLLSALGPQLLTVTALEIGGVLLLLAELGIVGLFIAGATFLVGDFGPIGPLKGRVPEWGQMLGAIQFYAITEQLSTVLPAVFIVVASATFALLSDGLRAASDPHSTRRLRPATFGVLAKVLTAALCFSAVGFIGTNVRTAPMTLDEGRGTSFTTAQNIWPGSVLVASVARYISPVEGFARPDRLTYYYRNERNEVLRISYLNAERLATEVRQYETEDELDFASLRPLPSGLATYEPIASEANSHDGGYLRAALAASIVRVIVTWPGERAAPQAYVTLGRPRMLVMETYCCFDAHTGVPTVDAAWYPPVSR